MSRVQRQPAVSAMQAVMRLALTVAAFFVLLSAGIAFADPAGTPRARSARLDVNGSTITPANVTTGWLKTNSAYPAVGISGSTATLISSRSSTTAGIWIAGNAASPTATNYLVEQESDGSVYMQSSGSSPIISFGINNVYGLVFSSSALTSSTQTVDFAAFKLSGKLTASSTAATISGGFGSGASITASTGTTAWTINVGTGGTASSGTFTMPAAVNEWFCDCRDEAAAVGLTQTRPSGGNGNSCSVANVNTATGVAAAWAASTVLRCTGTPL
jgi:hypothetical protein